MCLVIYILFVFDPWRSSILPVAGHKAGQWNAWHREASPLVKQRGLIQQEGADRMGVAKGRMSEIEQGQVSSQDVDARFAAALGGRLHQAIYFDDGDIAAIT